MKKLMTGLLFSAMFAGSAFAAPLPAGASDRVFATNLAGNVFFDLLIPEGGTETRVFSCGNCTDTAIVLLGAGGQISDIFTLVNDPAGSGNGTITFTSDVEGGPSLVAPPNAIFFQETQEPLEVTDFVNIRQFGQRLFIQSDVTAVPEPTGMALVGAGLLALLAGRGRKRAL